MDIGYHSPIIGYIGGREIDSNTYINKKKSPVCVMQKNQMAVRPRFEFR